MARILIQRRFRFMCALPCFVLVSAIVAVFQAGYANRKHETPSAVRSRHLLEDFNSSKVTLFECIPSGFDAFPGDFFTQEQRVRGGVLVHMLIAIYVCAMIAVVCDDYFIPSLDIIASKMKLPPDIAGATFMAIGTSAPELFSSITGAFITEGDIGVGTIIGSAVFNILAVTGLVGLVLWNEELNVDWYPIARDCVVYFLTIACLIGIISDNIVTWWESLILLVTFLLYIIIIIFNQRIEQCTKHLAKAIKDYCYCCCRPSEEEAPLLAQRVFVPELRESQDKRRFSEKDSYSVEITASKEQSVLNNHMKAEIADEIVFYAQEHVEGGLCSAPQGGFWSYVWWILMYPSNLLFFLTIPSISRFPYFYILTFLMSVIWIGVLSYLAVWMVTIIGYTLYIPDSVSGLTILAAGTSVPEIMSSIIVAKGGFGNMAISNLVGSNTFDISFCLGAPWLIKTLMSSNGYLLIYSSALTYTTATLLLTLLAFVLVLQLCHWKLNRTVGIWCMVIYVIFVTLACLYETNVIGNINLPPCVT